MNRCWLIFRVHLRFLALDLLGAGRSHITAVATEEQFDGRTDGLGPE